MKRFIILLCVIFFCGCTSITSPKYQAFPMVGPPMKVNTETGESWVFMNGYWVPVRDAEIVRVPPLFQIAPETPGSLVGIMITLAVPERVASPVTSRVLLAVTVVAVTAPTKPLFEVTGPEKVVLAIIGSSHAS